MHTVTTTAAEAARVTVDETASFRREDHETGFTLYGPTGEILYSGLTDAETRIADPWMLYTADGAPIGRVAEHRFRRAAFYDVDRVGYLIRDTEVGGRYKTQLQPPEAALIAEAVCGPGRFAVGTAEHLRIDNFAKLLFEYRAWRKTSEGQPGYDGDSGQELWFLDKFKERWGLEPAQVTLAAGLGEQTIHPRTIFETLGTLFAD